MKIVISMSDGVFFGDFVPVFWSVHHKIIQKIDGWSDLDVHLQNKIKYTDGLRIVYARLCHRFGDFLLISA